MRLIHERSAGIPLTYVHAIFPHAGTCLDPAGLQGLTRTTLRLMFAGARGLSNAELNGRLERLGASMAVFERGMPRGRLRPEETAAIRKARTEAELRLLRDEPVRLFASEGGSAWTVIYDDDPGFAVSCLNRVVRVKPVTDVAELPGLLRPLSRHLQSVGTALSPERLARLAGALAPIGVCRLCPVGQMPHPPLAWHHDGGHSLLPLLRWVAIEP